MLAEGFHERKGGPHAEAAALADAARRGVSREQMEGATCYVTLEPCHRGPGKTTPPCDEALVANGIRRVHIALTDPDPDFGKGADHLRSCGVDVTIGTAAEAVAASLRPYLHQRQTGRPYVVLKVATTTDGAIACKDGTSQWITGPSARAHSQMLRAASQAILVGSGTALADSPRLNLRLAEGALPDGALPPRGSPLRVLLDSRGRVVTGPLLDTTIAPTLVLTTPASRGSRARGAWAEAGVEVCELPAATGAAAASEGDEPSGAPATEDTAAGVDLGAALDEIGSRGVIQLMVRMRTLHARRQAQSTRA